MRLFGDLREFTRRLASGVAEVVELEVACVVVVVVVAGFVVSLALVWAAAAVVASWRKLRPLTASFFDPCWKRRWRRRCLRVSQLVAFPIQIGDAVVAADVSGDALGFSPFGSASSGRYNVAFCSSSPICATSLSPCATP